MLILVNISTISSFEIFKNIFCYSEECEESTQGINNIHILKLKRMLIDKQYFLGKYVTLIKRCM